MIAPFFVGDLAAPRFAGGGAFPHHPGNRMELAEVRQIGDVVLLRYQLNQATDDLPGGTTPHSASHAH